ncbi:hypothetical protein [uncultured Brachyspira sp.]|uniref:hypothetical protein n=1 Tax=uncultured Brachyspira sp. TaxID=221953 RepID=UPI0026344B34|nr:hypothetical protein [uncultured Brachyspira sp.]
MKKNYFLLLLIISLFMMSCGNHFFNPRYYYNKSSSTTELEEGTPADVELGISEVPADQDPFLNGQWNSIDYEFDGNKILEFLFAASFDNNNVPVYSFFKDGTQWEVSDALTAEKKYNAKDGANKAQGYSISSATFYRYDYKNPLIAPENSYNQSDRMKRFVFYRLVGNAVIVPLNNYLIAVDTYSKLVFAYGKITKTGSTMGQAYPTAFEAVELHGDKRPFYEYDPIGFMSYDASADSLKLTLYREYQNEMARDANAYFPQIHDASREIAGYVDANSAGRSPYYMVNLADIDPQTIIDQFKGKTYGIRDRLTLYTYKFSEDGKTLTVTKDHFYDGSTQNTYRCTEEVLGATSLKYGELTITGLGTYDKIKDGTREYILDYQDNGPAFVDRVAGKTYKAKDGTYEYKFNSTGTSLDYYDKDGYVRTYTFAEQDASDRAVYKETTSRYWGLRLADDESENIKDGVLYWSGSPWASPGTTPTQGVTSTPGYYKVNIISGGFVDNVKGKTYKYRDYSEYRTDSPLPVDYVITGKSLTLYIYEFTANGQTLNITEQVYGKNTTTTSYNIVSSSDKEAVYENNGVKVNVSIVNDNNRLYRDGKEVGDVSFIDHGPLFPDRVRGAVFKNGKTVYTFSEDGTSFTLDYEDGDKHNFKLARFDNQIENNNTAIYHDLDYWTQLTPYKRAKLVNDNTIVSSLLGGKIDMVGDAGDYKAYRQ